MTKQIQNIANAKNFNAVNIGKFDDIGQYITHSPAGDMPGKVFLKDTIDATGIEFSFQSMPPKTSSPFLHSHKQNEEVYIVISGSGIFQIDNTDVPITEGSIIRVSPAGVRGLKNTGDAPLVYMAIQVRENSLAQWTGDDGIIA